MTAITPMTGRPFVKMHGSRNHFVIVDARREPFEPGAGDIASICDPAVGVGADELIVMEPARRAGDVFMRIYNVDGREVEACGNATRCVAWLLFEEQGTDTAVVETLAGDLGCRRAGDRSVSAAMGKVSTDWRSVPLAEERDTLHLGLVSGGLEDPVAVNVGNPHAVFFVDDADAVDLGKDAPPVQQNPIFPNAANVGAAQLVDDSRIRLRVYERGAGLTMACGSGACAAVFAARQRGLTSRSQVDVELPGGVVNVAIDCDDTAVMTGPVAFCFTGNLPAGCGAV